MLNFIKIFLDKKPYKSDDEVLIDNIKNIPLDEKYLASTKNILEQSKFEKINIIYGEYITLKNKKADDCCIDIYFKKNKEEYMLTIYEDGIQLLKQVNIADNDFDYETLYRKEISKSILPNIKAL